MVIDTHKAVERLISSGNNKESAEVIVDIINSIDDKVATKADVKEVQFALRQDIVEIKTELKWMRILMLSVLGLLIKVAFFN